MKRRPQLALVLTAILVLVCRCDNGGRIIGHVDGGSTICNEYSVYFEADAPSNTVYVCPLTCPNGDKVSFEIWSFVELRNMTAAQAQEKYCPVIPDSTEDPTEPPPTEPPATDPPPIVYPPILTGEVVSCNLNSLKISLRLLPGVDPSTLPEYDLLFNGQPLVCTPSPSSADLLECKLPASIVFPATLAVTRAGDRISEFPFDHSVCTVEDTSGGGGNNNDDDEGDEGDEDNPDEGSNPDCQADPSQPGC